MSIEQAMQGKWCLLVEEEPYRDEGRTVIEFRDGVLVGSDGVANTYHVAGNTITAQLADQYTITVNPGDPETGTVAPEVAPDAKTVRANVTTSFEDGSDDLVEYAMLVREAC